MHITCRRCFPLVYCGTVSVKVSGCVLVDQAAGFSSVSLKPLDGMEGLNISVSSSRPKDGAALAALMRLCQGWQKPGATVPGKCVLVSRSRLEVDIGYQADVIGIFKQMPSKCYGECDRNVNRSINIKYASCK